MSTGTSNMATRAVRDRQLPRLTDLKYRWSARYRAAWVALVLVVIGAVVFAPHALDGASLSLVTGLAGVLAIASFGQMLIVMTGAIDLSISAIVSLAAGIVVHYAGNGANVPALVVASLVISVLLSLVNGFLIKILRLNAVIVTLATVSMITGAIQLWTGVALSKTGAAPHVLQQIAQFNIYRVNAVFVAAGLLGVAGAFHLGKTRTGRRIAFVGSNRRAAVVIGTRVRSVELMVFAIAGLLYGVAGVLLAGYVGSPDVLAGNQYQLLTITVAGVAGVLFTGGPASVASVMVACLFLVLLDQVLSIVGIAPGVSVVIQGLVLAAAVSAITVGQLSAGFGRRRVRRSP
jgi:ribose transport system permease protein